MDAPCVVVSKASFLKWLWENSVSTLSMFFGLFGLGQATFYHQHDLQWAEIDYYLQVRQVHIETLNNLREDVRDMYEMDGRQLDTRMIVMTLLLSIGFGFVVEGTFPPSDPGQTDPKQSIYIKQHPMRIFYACIAGCSLMSPFCGLIALMECRRRLDVFMEHFNDKLYRMLRHRYRRFQTETRTYDDMQRSDLIRYTDSLPEEPHPELGMFYDLPCCPHRSKRLGIIKPVMNRLGVRSRVLQPDFRLNRDTPIAEFPRGKEPGDFDIILKLHSNYVTWWANWCEFYAELAKMLTWAAMIFNVFCCALLLGMYFQYNYADTPEMWKLYSFIIVGGLIITFAFKGLAHFLGPNLTVRYQHVETGQSIPEWMLEDPNDELRSSGSNPEYIFRRSSSQRSMSIPASRDSELGQPLLHT